MEEEYTLFIPENIKIQTDLFGDMSKADFFKMLFLSAVGGIPIGLSYFITHVDYITVIGILTWVFLMYEGYVKILYEKRRSIFGHIKVMLNWKHCQKKFSYQYKPEWRLYE